MVEFIQEVGLSDGTYPDILQEVARNMYSNKNEALSTQTLSQMLLEFTSAKQVDIFKHAGSIPECQVQNSEVALWLMGEFKDNFVADNKEIVQTVLNPEFDLSTLQAVVKMRLLWLLEKLSSHDPYLNSATDKTALIQTTFQRLVDIFTNVGDSFPVKYQCLRSLYRYTKKINLKETYGDQTTGVITAILKEINHCLL